MTAWRRHTANSSEQARQEQRIIAIVNGTNEAVQRLIGMRPDEEVRVVDHVDEAIKLAAGDAGCVLVIGSAGSPDAVFSAILDSRGRGRAAIASVVLADRPTSILLRQAMRAGAVDVVRTLAPDEELMDALDRAWAESTPIGAPEQHAGRVVAVFSPKGGAGCTTLTVNLAALAAASMKCMVVDTDMPFSDVAVLMSVEPRTSVADLTGADLDQERLESALTTHASGVRVLPGPPDPARAEVVTAPTISRVLEMSRSVADLVLVDTASAFDDVTLAVLEAADDVLLLCTADLAAIKNAKVALATFRLLGIPEDHVHLVLNRVAGKGTLGVADIEKQLGPAEAVVAEDAAFGRSGAMGLLASVVLPKNSVLRPLSQLVQRIATGGS